MVNFKYVLDTIISFGVPVAVASPGTVLTEGPAFAPDSARFNGKSPAQADYCNVVKQVAVTPLVLVTTNITPSTTLMNEYDSMKRWHPLYYDPNLPPSLYTLIAYTS